MDVKHEDVKALLIFLAILLIFWAVLVLDLLYGSGGFYRTVKEVAEWSLLTGPIQGDT